MKTKKKYVYSKLTISVSPEDMALAETLRVKHYVNISAFIRQKLKELYESLNEDNKNI